MRASTSTTIDLDILHNARKPVQACAWSHPNPKTAPGIDDALRKSNYLISRDMEKPT